MVKFVKFPESSERREPLKGYAPVSDCPVHPRIEPEIGFGLAGGGYGTYYYCPRCSRILSKTQEVE